MFYFRTVDFFGGRKGHQQDPAGIGSVDDQVGDAMRHGVGLPRASAGDDQERLRRCVLLLDAMLDGSSLFRIESLKIGGGHSVANRSVAGQLINHLSRFVRNSYPVSSAAISELTR